MSKTENCLYGPRSLIPEKIRHLLRDVTKQHLMNCGLKKSFVLQTQDVLNKINIITYVIKSNFNYAEVFFHS